MKNTFSLVSTYINWSSLSLPTPRMRKASRFLHGLCSPPTGKTALLQAVQIQLLSLRNERRDFHRQASSLDDRRYLRGGRSSPRWSSVCPAVRQQCFTMSSLKARHANSSVVGCKNQHKCLYSVPATEQQKRQWLRFIFNGNVPAVVRVSLYVCANHYTSDCFSKFFSGTDPR